MRVHRVDRGWLLLDLGHETDRLDAWVFDECVLDVVAGRVSARRARRRTVSRMRRQADRVARACLGVGVGRLLRVTTAVIVATGIEAAEVEVDVYGVVPARGSDPSSRIVVMHLRRHLAIEERRTASIPAPRPQHAGPTR